MQRGWFAEDPPPLPNRRAVSAEDAELVRRVEASGVTDGTRRADMFKVWNSVFVGPDPCAHPYLKDAPGQIYVYDPPDGSPWPRFRFLPDTTTPIGLVTNAYGFRGGPVTLGDVSRGRSASPSSARRRRWPRTISPTPTPSMLAIGSIVGLQRRSSTFASRSWNAGRESIGSPDIAAIMKNEVAPLAPDLVVYYEGANQFYLEPLVPQLPPRPARLPVATPPAPGLFERILEDL